MVARLRRRGSLRALLGAVALLLQFVLPAVHPQHASQASTSCADHQVVAHDALACPLCAAIAHGGAGGLDVTPAPPAPAASLADVGAPVAPLLSAPALSGAAPRGPPALA